MVAQWPYTLSVTENSSGDSRSFPVDTSFEPYRREAFRHKSIPPQRESIMMTNIVGQGTVNTEGLWRREQTDWEEGAGQYFLDKKGETMPTRFHSSKGVDVFSYPYQATLLADTYNVFPSLSASNNLNISRCGDFVVVVNGTTVSYYTPTASSSSIPTLNTCTFNTVYGGTTPASIRSIDSNDTYCFIATDTGIWFSNIGRAAQFTANTTSGSNVLTGISNTSGLSIGMSVTGSGVQVGSTIQSVGSTSVTINLTATATASSVVFTSQYTTGPAEFRLYAGSDDSTYQSGGYDMVRIANDQLVASRGNRLYAFQPRSATVSPTFGTPPSSSSVGSSISTAYDDGTGTNTWVFNTTGPHGLKAGQRFTVSAAQLGYTMYNNGSLTTSYQGSAPSISFAANTKDSLGVTTKGSNLNIAVGDNISVAVTETTSTATNIAYDTGVVTAVGPGTISIYSYPGVVTYNSNNFVGVSNLMLDPLALTQRVLITNQTNVTAALTGTYSVKAVTGTNSFTVTDSSLLSWQNATGGTINPSYTTDVLMTHQNPSWVWSDATGGATQIYFAGYAKNPSGQSNNGCIYKSTLLGSSTTTATGVAAVSNTSVFQPFSLNYPTQALPMSPDEYPTCIQSYLNFVFVGTNRGIRMAQTLSVYDPSSTSTGDLKAGAIIPNMLPTNIAGTNTPAINYPVTAIVGDGRFVWFSWNKYDDYSTGLGKLDLTNFINGDALTPAYASDIMVGPIGVTYNTATGQGMINGLIWDPARNLPAMAIGGVGIYTAEATNTTGLWNVSKFVSNGTINSPLFDYGLPEEKVALSFDVGMATPSNGGGIIAYVNNNPDMPAYSGVFTSSSSTVTNVTHIDKLSVGMLLIDVNNLGTLPQLAYITSINTSAQTITVSVPAPASGSMTFGAYATVPATITSPSSMVAVNGLSETSIAPTRGNEFQVKVLIYPDGTRTQSPVLHRWTLKSWPTVVQGTDIMAVFQLFSVAVVDGSETYVDPYDNFTWLENLRQKQSVVTYQEGPLSVSAIVLSIDWLPHKRRDNYENGFEGDCVVTFKTVDKYTYTPVVTS